MTTPTRRLYQNPIFDSARWDSYRARPDDILIATPPKCGTTWMQRIVSCLVFGSSRLPDDLDSLSPWFDYLLRDADLDALLARLEAQRHRRFVKTHLPADGLPELPETVRYVFVARDLRDAVLSFHNQMWHSREAFPGIPGDPREFWRLVFSGGTIAGDFVIRDMFTGPLATWWQRRNDPRVLMVHYQDMLDDLEGQMRRVAGHLGITIPEETWPELVNACRFETMRADSARLVPPVPAEDGEQWFFHRGTSGQWRGTVTDEDLALYAESVASLPAGLRSWLEPGGPVT